MYLATRKVAAAAVFTAAAVGTDYALFSIPNVKLMDLLVFSAGYLFGAIPGIIVASMSWLIYGNLNPWGSSGPLLPFQIAFECTYALAGALLARYVRALRKGDGILFGLVGLLGALTYDVGTNVASALLYHVPVLLMVFGPQAIPFSLMHEFSDFVFFMIGAPAIILGSRRVVHH
jgi:hypothetical protein